VIKMLDKLKALNTGIPFYSVNDPEFLSYGKVIKGYDLDELIDKAMKIEMPESGSKYELSIEQLEECEVVEKLRDECFGEIDIQVGYCWGFNDMMNAMEYHKSSEINIAVTPMVLLLGLVTDIKDDGYDSSNVKAFFLDKGEVMEIYGTTLHFCPCQVDKDGFRCIVVLPKGTNGLLKNPAKGSILFKQNKWLICHDKNEALIERGVCPYIHGTNIKINGL